VTALDTDYGETSHRFPVFLPDGRHFLYTGVVGTCCPPTKPAQLRIGTLDGSGAAVLATVESSAAYADGHLLYNHGGTLLARPFDAASRTFSGDPFLVAEGLASEGSRYASFSASATGVLAYVLGDIRERTRLSWFNRSGQRLGTIGSGGSGSTIALSPDEQRVALSMPRGLPPNIDVYLVDLATGREDRFTFDSAPDGAPLWSPDGQQVFFTSTRPGTTDGASRAGVSVLMRKPVDASRPEELLLEATDGLGTIVPLAWSPDGGHLMLNRTLGAGGSRDVWVLPASGDRKPRPFVQTPAEDLDAAFSADGRYVAYQSAEGGPYQVYVEAFPDRGGRRQISRDGGSNPYWRADGRELFYVDLSGRLIVVETDTRQGLRSGVPTPLFTLRLRPGADGRQFAVTRDGQRILVNELEDQSASSPVNVLVNWLARAPSAAP
jgi:dipeptidyl aminopeptidase/acylaminoacyl peptidase